MTSGHCLHGVKASSRTARMLRNIVATRQQRDIAKVDGMVAPCFASQDYIDGRRAFMEKRKPQFAGR